MPLADGIGRIARAAEDFGECLDVVGQFQTQSGVARIGVGDKTVPGAVRIQAGEKSCARRRAEGRRVIVGHPNALRGKAVEGGSLDLGAERPDVAVPHVVDQNHDDVG